ncbi:membrane protein [Clostridia bacterium]|nr:membrane protein [Clostridia bacterium]
MEKQQVREKIEEKNYQLLIDVAVRAGELLLKSGSETHRIEDTVCYILQMAKLSTVEVLVIATGFVVTLSDPTISPLTITKRIHQRAGNLSMIHEVNRISRSYCSGQMTLQEAWLALEECEQRVDYAPWVVWVASLCTSTFFALLLGGNVIEILCAFLCGVTLMGIRLLFRKIRTNRFCQDLIASLGISFVAYCLNFLFQQRGEMELIIASSIMPLLPGMIFTTAVRDILHGDYLSGCSRMLEAVVIALGVAVGVGAGIGLFRLLFR